MSFKSQSSRVAALVVACSLALAAVAIAQLTPNSRGVQPSRILIGAYNNTDTLIQDGTLVIIDSVTAANGKGVAVRPHDGTCLNRNRVIGLAFGNIAARRGAPGNVLIFGVHNNAKVASSTLALNIPVKPAVLHGKLATTVDTVTMAVGWVVGFSPSNTASNPRAQVFITQAGRHATAL